MKNFKKIVSITLVLVMTVTVPAFAGNPLEKEKIQEIKGDYVDGEVIVICNKSEDIEEVCEDIEDENCSIEKTESLDRDENVIYAKTEEGESVAKTINELQKNSNVSYVQPNYKYKPLEDKAADLANDSKLYKQYYLDAINAAGAWRELEGKVKNKVKVAVIDSGADINHEDLKINTSASRTMSESITSDEEPLHGDGDRADGHGTHVSGTIAGTTNNNKGIAGVAGVKIGESAASSTDIVDLIVVGASEGDTDPPGFSTATLIRAVNYCSEKAKARLINMSLGGPFSGSDEDIAFQKAIANAYSKGTVCICAAGNDGIEGNDYPANADKAVGVIALNTDAKTKADFSNYGDRKNKVSAPGVGIFSTVPKDTYGPGYRKFNGTSMASPIVTGVAAMIVAANPGITADGIVSTLHYCCDDLMDTGYDDETGYGRVNALKAVKAATCSHSWNAGKVIKAATAGAKGTKLCTCSNCAATKYVSFSVPNINNLKVSSVKYNTCKLSWSKASGDINKYWIYRKDTVNKTWKKVKELASKTTQYSDINLVEKRKYYYKVRGAYVKDSKTSLGSFTKTYSAVPAVPKISGFTLRKSGKSNIITWKRAKDSKIIYEVYRSENKKKWKKIASLKNNVVKYTDKKVSKKYYYRMRAVDISGKKKHYSAYAVIKRK